jgi:hypothetical protein
MTGVAGLRVQISARISIRWPAGFLPRALFVTMLLGACPGAAQGAMPTAAAEEGAIAPGQHYFGFGATVGFWSGSGAMVGGGSDVVKAWASGGYAPVMVFANERTANRALRFNYYNAYQLNGDLALGVYRRPRVELSLLLGYKFNSVLGHGGGAGIGVLYDLGPRLGVMMTAGAAVFPSAKDRLDADGYPSDRSPSLTPALQGGANLALIFFP